VALATATTGVGCSCRTGGARRGSRAAEPPGRPRYSNTPRALAEYLGLTKGTVSQTLLLLHRRGLVLRSEDPADRRLVRLRLSPKGQRLAQRAGDEDDLVRELEALPPSEREAGGRVLQKLLTGLQRRRGNLSFGECHTCRHFRREGAGFRCGLTGEPLDRDETLQICREHAWAGGAEPDPGA